MPVHLEGFSGGDRTTIDLPAVQEDLLKAVAATGKPLIVVLQNGSALAVNWAAAARQPPSSKPGIPAKKAAPPSPKRSPATTIPPAACPLTFYASLDSAPALRGLLDEEPHLPLLHRQAALHLRLRPQLHHLRLQPTSRSRQPVHAGDTVTVEADSEITASSPATKSSSSTSRSRAASRHPSASSPASSAFISTRGSLNARRPHHRPPLPQPGRRQGQPHHPPRRLHPLPRQHPARQRRDHPHRPLHRYRSARTPQITALHTRSEDIYIDINTSHLERRSELHKERAALSSRPH